MLLEKHIHGDESVVVVCFFKANRRHGDAGPTPMFKRVWPPDQPVIHVKAHVHLMPTHYTTENFQYLSRDPANFINETNTSWLYWFYLCRRADELLLRAFRECIFLKATFPPQPSIDDFLIFI